MDTGTYDQIDVGRDHRRRRRELPAREPGRDRRHQRRAACSTSSCPRRSCSRSPTPSPACRATAPPAAPSRRRSRPAPRSRCRCSSSQGDKVKVDTRDGVLPRPRQAERTRLPWQHARKARKRALDILFEAEQRGVNARDAARRAPRRPATEAPTNQYTVELVRGRRRARGPTSTSCSTTYTQGWTLERMPARRPRDPAARRLRGALRRRRPRRRSRSPRPWRSPQTCRPTTRRRSSTACWRVSPRSSRPSSDTHTSATSRPFAGGSCVRAQAYAWTASERHCTDGPPRHGVGVRVPARRPCSWRSVGRGRRRAEVWTAVGAAAPG